MGEEERAPPFSRCDIIRGKGASPYRCFRVVSVPAEAALFFARIISSLLSRRRHTACQRSSFAVIGKIASTSSSVQT